jgi:hypothetical protein
VCYEDTFALIVGVEQPGDGKSCGDWTEKLVKGILECHGKKEGQGR